MHQNGPNSSDGGSLNRPQYRLSQHAPAKPVALKTPVHSQPTQHHHRNGVWHVTPHAARDSGMCHRTRCQAIVRHHLLR